ncbi:argonaute [Sodiomyces alkalinus F11]|uniref:Argonaute n=1 Tax=Sodiomyces alkalinus (strain CBS 110278 / VKM F-3762 / F11) TaxID=1314773 RepID=A0A3N2PML1_SODAK|nr:argonaute [Sodiomyces alkalinus F11]ROT35771.1 argonaute [Sodiomyces alkalinus F11]
MSFGSSQGGRQGAPPGPAGPSQPVSGSAQALVPQSGQAGYSTPLGYDPARTSTEDKGNTRLDLPLEAYITAERLRNAGIQAFARRPKTTPIGKPVDLEVNQFRVNSWNDQARAYQFDVSITPAPLKLGPVFKKCWNHPDVKAALAKYNTLWLYDGKKLAWSSCPIQRGEERIRVDLDKDLPPRADGKPRRTDNEFYFVIRQTAEINLAVLEAYLKGQCDWNSKVLECMNFLDHLVRQWPSENLVSIKRSFYPTQSGQQVVRELSSCVWLIKGVYASVRMNQSVVKGIGRGLGLNVDVANTAFWASNKPMPDLIREYLAMVDPKLRGKSMDDLVSELRPVPVKVKDGRVLHSMSHAFKLLRRLSKLQFTVRHRAKEQNERQYRILTFEFAEKYREEGATARNVMIPNRDGNGTISILEYFKKQYGYNIKCPDFPLILTSKAGLFPIDVCNVSPMQRFPFKLGPDETRKMIEHTATLPNQRRQDIMTGKRMLNWPEDPFLRQYGIKFDENMAKTTGRLLDPPVVQFANGQADPKFEGRWDLRGKKFLEPNAIALSSWGFMILERSATPEHTRQFAMGFKKKYMEHGGKITSDPIIITSQGHEPNVAEAVKNGINEIRRQTNQAVQILFCILKWSNSGNYERLKKSADCRFGVLTQVILSKHVPMNKDQYHSNVAMKVNAKLGGTTSFVPKINRAKPKDPSPPFFSVPTMIIGVDVTHGTPGVPNVPSMAAMTMSMDKYACRYAAAVQTNGFRVELLAPTTTQEFLGKLLPMWQKKANMAAPHHIIYFRDGVSEGQFAQVLETEIAVIKDWFRTELKKFNAPMPKFTVIVATKRHHIRFFPRQGQGDRNGNPRPGTLLETEVCHPFYWDFYLCAHSAIKGTSRPVHYTVLLDESGMNPATLQMMIYQHSYQYMRSTTPVSLHPAIYYADLACGRARTHETIATSEGYRSGPKAAEVAIDVAAFEASLSNAKIGTDSLPLLPMGGEEALEINKKFFPTTMWYI